MPLDPQARQLLDYIASLQLPELWQISPAEGRAAAAKSRAALPPGPETHSEDHVVPTGEGGVPVRLYKPLHSTPGARLPVLIWFHGGGFVIGSVSESDADCRHLSVQADCAVLSVDYRLAPEHPFPAAPDDCFAALEWVHARADALGLDPARVAVGGDSAGGNLAAVTALRARERSGPAIRYQVLIYPVIDLVSFDTASYRENADGYYLSRRTMEWFRELYVPDASLRNRADVSPQHARALRDLPPAFVATAEYDPLRDEGDAFAARLAAAGVPVKHHCYEGMIHGCFSMHPFLDGGRRMLEDASSAVREALVRA